MTNLHISGGADAVSIALLSPAALAERLRAKAEIAVLDIRELNRHTDDGHILLSAPLPFSWIETSIARLVPRRETPVIVYDGDDEGLARRAADRLVVLGYTDVSVLEGGVAAWAADGRETYTGIHVLSKAFGEFVEHAYGTPNIDVRELRALLADGQDVIVLDGRSLEEFNNFSIPGAWACPNAELPYRVHDLAPSPDTLVVVNCAGRTRSIIGAQALINSGLPNRVVALENGAMAWLAEGYELDTDKLRPAPAPSDDGRRKARNVATDLRRRFDIASIGRQRLAVLAAERDRSLYLLDVRTRAEYEAGHLPGSTWAEGGQLIQGTDQWIATFNARIVLVDNPDGVRSAITASWLKQLGWDEVQTYEIDPATEVLETGPEPALVAGETPVAETIAPVELQAALDAGNAVLFDFSVSNAYAAGHVPGAIFALRSRIDARIVEAAGARDLVVTAADPRLAELAARDLMAAAGRPVRILNGGVRAWREAGLPVAGADQAIWHDNAEDAWKSPYFREDRFAAFQEYIDWEVGLIHQIERDDTVSFQKFPI